nr:homocitrate synthase [Dehalococcoidales bacterium]
MPQIHFVDVTNRDGVQTARINLAKLQKTMLNYYLSCLGIYQSEFGFPYLRTEETYIRANLELAELGVFGDMRLSGWIRAVPQDVERSLPSGVRHLNLSISTSDQMIVNKFKGKLDRESILGEMAAAVKTATEGGILTIGVNAEDASRTDLGYLTEFALAARAAGAHRIRYCDTLGCDSPDTIYMRLKTLAEAVQLPIEVHTHNDLGLAVANAVAGAKGALDGGVDAYVNVTVNGVGERAGNADLLSCILALRYANGLRDQVAIGDELDLTVAWRLARYTARAFGLPIPIN